MLTVNGTYKLQIGEPFWMPEIGLGIGRSRSENGGIDREVLRWFDSDSTPYLTGEERAIELQNQIDRYRQQFGKLPDSEF